MTTHRTTKQIRDDIAVLQEELNHAIEIETAVARDKIKAIMESVGMTADQLFQTPPRKQKGVDVPVKYRKGDKAWTGHGRMPGWLVAEANPELFRV